MRKTQSGKRNKTAALCVLSQSCLYLSATLSAGFIKSTVASTDEAEFLCHAMLAAAAARQRHNVSSPSPPYIHPSLSHERLRGIPSKSGTSMH